MEKKLLECLMKNSCKRQIKQNLDKKKVEKNKTNELYAK